MDGKKMHLGRDESSEVRKFAALALMVCAFYLSMADAAYAQDALSDVLCTVISWFAGNLGKGLASLGVCVVGCGCVLGKVSWGMALTVGIGISVLFGAAAIVEDLNIGAATCT